ncbi:MAG: 5-carboxymethyl-2-hydroxymuconate Delta-isomerase [Anaerolineales bacterium]|nr:5-carboxymethyl-2-hydroxymuconate Delta-isomerase [Anaerolineales bacterium]
MPHLTLEYTNNLTDQINYDDLFSKLHQAISDTTGIDIQNCKSRAVCHDTFWISTGDASNAFVNLIIRIFEGRPAKIKQDTAQQCMAVLKEFYGKSLAGLDLQISIEIQDIQRQFYFKLTSENA